MRRVRLLEELCSRGLLGPVAQLRLLELLLERGDARLVVLGLRHCGLSLLALQRAGFELHLLHYVLGSIDRPVRRSRQLGLLMAGEEVRQLLNILGGGSSRREVVRLVVLEDVRHRWLAHAASRCRCVRKQRQVCEG